MRYKQPLKRSKARTGDDKMLSKTIPNKELQSFNSYNTITVHTPIAHSIGTNEAIVYSALVSKFFYSHERNALTEDGYFMVCEDDLRESTTLYGKSLTRPLKNIENAGLIKMELRGMPAKRYVYIVRNEKLLLSLLNEGAEAAAENYRQTTDATFWNVDESAAHDESIDGLLSLFSERHRIYVNRPLAHSIGLDPAVAWAVIVTKYYQCQRYNSLREDGSFYVTEADFENMCGYKRRKQKAAIDKLIEQGFIITFLAGAPAKRYFRITVTPEMIGTAITSGLKTTKEVYSRTSEAAERSVREQEIAEKNRIATADEIDEYIRSKIGQVNEEIQIVQKGETRTYNTETAENGEKITCTDGEIQIVQKGETRMYKTANQDCTKGQNKNGQKGETRLDKRAEHTFNLNIYNHDISQSVSREQLDAVCTDTDKIDGLTDKQTEIDDFSSTDSNAMKLMKERIDYAWYEKHLADGSFSERTKVRTLSQLDLVLDVMLDALRRAKEKGYISLSKNGRVVTFRELRSHFLDRLERRHIEYLFGKLEEQRNIKNIRAYVLTAIYNAVDEADMVADDKNSTINDDLWYEMAESFDPWDEIDESEIDELEKRSGQE